MFLSFISLNYMTLVSLKHERFIPVRISINKLYHSAEFHISNCSQNSLIRLITPLITQLLINDFPDSKASCLQCRRPGFDPWVGKIFWSRKWQPTPVLLPGKSHGRRSLVGYSPWGHKKLDTTEWPHFTSLVLFTLIEFSPHGSYFTACLNVWYS